MPHLAPFMWGIAPLLISITGYLIYISFPHPIMFIPPRIHTFKSNNWTWQ